MPGEYCALVEASVLDNLGKKFYLGGNLGTAQKG